jgi:hypothetical protein
MSPPFYFVSGEKEDGAWWVRIWGRRDRSGIRTKLHKKYSVCPDFRRTSSIPAASVTRIAFSLFGKSSHKKSIL